MTKLAVRSDCDPIPRHTNNGHVICCNDSVEHVVIGTAGAVKAKLEELAKDHFLKSQWIAWQPCDGEDAYKEYRKRYFWHVHTVGLTRN